MSRTSTKFLIVFAPPAVLLGALLLQPWVDPRWAFPDPIVAAQSSGDCCSAYFGFVSNLGVVYWCVAATACGCAAIVLASASAASREVAFMAAGAALSAGLGLDDLLLLHERILPKLGLPQTLILAAYAVATLAYLAVFFRKIRQGDAAILSLGLLALGLSLGLDVFVSDQTDGVKLAEDSAKFVGIAGWAGFHISRALTAMTGLAAGDRAGWQAGGGR